MSYDLIKANLNLYAVLQNLEDLVKYDTEMANLTRDWDVTIQFSIRGGTKSYIEIKNGVCKVGKGKYKSPHIRLFFTSPNHCNKMFAGKGDPIPLKGFSKLRFLTKDFPKLIDKLEYYLKPTDKLLKKKKYLEINTRMTLNTAVFALRELALLDPIGKLNAAHIMNGTVEMRILPSGPAAHITFKDGEIESRKGEAENPFAIMAFKNSKAANDLFNNRIDAFTAVAGGEVMLRGQIAMLDSLNPILDRIELYLA